MLGLFNKMRHFYLLAFYLVTVHAMAQTPSPSPVTLNAAQISNIQAWSSVYGISADKLSASYSKILGDNSGDARAAAYDLEKGGVFKPLVAAAQETTNAETKIFLIKMIVLKRDYSPDACSFLLDQLDSRNSTIPSKDADRAGAEMIKRQIATAVARWLDIADPNIPFSPYHSQAAYAAFSAQARSKAATMAGDSLK